MYVIYVQHHVCIYEGSAKSELISPKSRNTFLTVQVFVRFDSAAVCIGLLKRVQHNPPLSQEEQSVFSAAKCK